MKTYTINEAKDLLKVSERAVQRRCKRHGIPIKNGQYCIDLATLISWGYKTNIVPEHPDAKPNTTEHIKIEAGQVIEQADGSIIECFDQDKYKSLEQALIERLELKIKVRELSKRLEQLQQWKNDFMQYTNQRNTIEAFEKGVIQPIDKEEVDDSNLTESDTADIQQPISL
jgi:tRNA(Ile)-lysidine synthase TilS/MesJ